jgi:hypothetical protein
MFCYRSLRNWKYELTEDYLCQTEIKSFDIKHDYVLLNPDGLLFIPKGYMWDGASGPTIDTKDSMEPSLVHDALCQLMRLNLLPFDKLDFVNDLFYQMCIISGMSKFRAWIWRKSLGVCCGSFAKPGTEEPDKIVCS